MGRYEYLTTNINNLRLANVSENFPSIETFIANKTTTDNTTWFKVECYCRVFT